MRPYFVGIAGPSCAGKSLLAAQLAEEYADKRACVLPLDSYFYDLSVLRPSERNQQNFDVPEAIDIDLFLDQVASLSVGRAVEKPLYDFTTHTRHPESERVLPGELVFLEGLFVLHWKRIRDFIHTRVFVMVTEEISRLRRLERDMVERGRSRDYILWQYDHAVRPMNRKYVAPTVSFADIVVSGTDPIDQTVARIKSELDRSIKRL